MSKKRKKSNVNMSKKRNHSHEDKIAAKKAAVLGTEKRNRLPIFVGIAGEVLMSQDDGNSFALLPVSSGNPIFTVAEGPGGSLLVGGPAGIQKLTLPQ